MKHKKQYAGGVYLPQRTCAACRALRPQRELLRIAAFQGTAAVERGKRLPGRGAYLCKSAQCVEKAQKSRALQRALKCAVGDEIYEECMHIVS